MGTALILFAHGARDASWAAPFEAIAARVRAERPTLELRLAYLEHLQPDLMHATAELVAAGCTQVQILPMFLGAGGHVQRDLPRLMQALMGEYPDVGFTLHAAVGEMPAITRAMAEVAASLVAGAL